MKIYSLISLSVFIFLIASEVRSSHYAEGLLAIHQQNWEKAAHHLELLFEDDNTNKSEIALILAQLDQKFLTQDRLYYALVADRDSSQSSAPLHRIIADLSFKEANFERAEKYYRQILDSNHSLSEYARYQLAWVKVNQGQIHQSIELLAQYNFDDPESTLQAPIARDLGRFTVEAIDSSTNFQVPHYRLESTDNLQHFFEGIMSGLNRSKSKDKMPIIARFRDTSFYPDLMATFIQKKAFNLHCEWIENLSDEQTQRAANWLSPNESLHFLQNCPGNKSFALQLATKLSKEADYLEQAALYALNLGHDDKGCQWLLSALTQNSDSQSLILATQKCRFSQKQFKKIIIPKLTHLSESDFSIILQKLPTEIMSYALKHDVSQINERLLQTTNIRLLANADAITLTKILEKSENKHMQWLILTHTTGKSIPKSIRLKLVDESFGQTLNQEDSDLWFRYLLEQKEITMIDWSAISLPKDHLITKNRSLIEQILSSGQITKDLFDEIKDLTSLLARMNKQTWFHRTLFEHARMNLQERQSMILKRIRSDIESTTDSEKKNQLTLIYQAVEKILEGRTA